MSTDDGRYHIVFNGEIYNYVELGRELERRGRAFRSRSDTEVLLAAYERWGAECLGRLVGMFAFAVLDVGRREVFLARDPFGIKPLYYTHPRGGFAFCSEIAPLLDLDGVGRRVAPQPLYDYLVHGRTDAGEHTLFESVLELPAAHYACVSIDRPGSCTGTRYWELRKATGRPPSIGEAAAQLRDLFLENIRLHLRSDVPVGAALSGGIDSSAIVAGMRHVAGSGLELRTFSYIAKGSALSEERWVDEVTDASRACARKVSPRPGDLVEDLPRLLRIQEQPFGSMSIYVQYRVFRLAREAGIRVMLDGQGADEMLAGYSFFAAVQLASLVRQWRLAAAIRFFRGASRGVGRGPVWLASRAGQFLVPAMLEKPLRSMARAERTPSWLDLDWFERRGAGPREHRRARGGPSLRSVMAEQLTGAGLGALLRYEDRNSMAHSIESRVPFLTTGLAEFLFSLPDDYLVSVDGVTKSVFRRAMRGLVPDAILDRGDKIGFSTPEVEWIREVGGWAEDVLTSDHARGIPALDVGSIEREWRAVDEGRLGFRRHIWRWLNLLEWARDFDVVFS
jgi:asparagine synthase (glutamine-hydrolysing)